MTIKDVKNKKDFKILMNIYKTSAAPLQKREAAIKKLQQKFPEFTAKVKKPSSDHLARLDMKESAADNSDILSAY